MAEIGSVLDGRYQIESELCTGGMSRLYLARNTRLDKLVVVKEVSENGENQNYLKSEAKILARLDHPDLVKIIDFIPDQYLIMEYVYGKNLEEVVKESGNQPQENVISWALQITDVLSYLHNLNPVVIHRDIKPSNCIVQAKGRIKLVDFGISREIKSSATQTKIGTPGYVAPEGYDGNFVPKSDVYSLGATMLAVLLAENPNFTEIKIRKLRNSGNNVSGKLIDIIEGTLSYEPAQRYSAEELYEVLIKLNVKSIQPVNNSSGNSIEINSSSPTKEKELKAEEPDEFLRYVDGLIERLGRPDLEKDKELISSFLTPRFKASVKKLQNIEPYANAAYIFKSESKSLVQILENVKKKYNERNENPEFFISEINRLSRVLHGYYFFETFFANIYAFTIPQSFLDLRQNILRNLQNRQKDNSTTAQTETVKKQGETLAQKLSGFFTQKIF